jgi:hypothetical protein
MAGPANAPFAKEATRPLALRGLLLPPSDHFLTCFFFFGFFFLFCFSQSAFDSLSSMFMLTSCAEAGASGRLSDRLRR